MYLKYAVEVLDHVQNPKPDETGKKICFGCPRLAIIHVPDGNGFYRIMEVSIFGEEEAFVRFIEFKSKYGDKLNINKLHEKMKTRVFKGDDFKLFQKSKIDFCMSLPSGMASSLDYWIAAEAETGGTIAIQAGILIGSNVNLIPWIDNIEKIVFTGEFTSESQKK